LLSGPLVVGAEPLIEGGSGEEAGSVNPEVVAEREKSRTRFEGLDAEQAAQVAGEAFPVMVNQLAGGPPSSLPGGEQITRFVSADAASLALAGGGRGVLESGVPMAVQASGGGYVPIDLGLVEVGGVFQPRTPAAGVGVRIPKRLADGVSLASGGVSLTPVDEHGVALGGAEGAVRGATVFYGSTGSDTAVAVKPVTFGFDLQTLLYSILSPEKLFFRVGLPEGATLTQPGAFGGVQVLDAGQAIATIDPPSAQDAEGRSVPVSVGVEGDVLSLVVDHLAGSYRYPIVVDPSVAVDKELLLPGNWAFGTDNPEAFSGYEEFLEDHAVGIESNPKGDKYTAGQYGIIQYPTQHESRVYEFFAHSEQFDNQITEEIEPSVFIANSKKEVENTGGKVVVLPFGGKSETTLCVEAGCTTGSVAAHHENFAELEEYVRISGEDVGFAAKLTEGTFVAIAQEKGPVVGVDTTDAVFGSALNGAYPGQWVNGSGKIGTVPTDPGIGISAAGYSSPQASGWGHSFQAVSGCKGVQCDECWNWSSKCESGHSTSGEPLTYSLSGLPDGKDTVEVEVENATGETATTTGTVLMDSTPPHNITLSGLGSGNQIGEYEDSHFKVEVTDGSGSTPSSGVKSIAVAVDGREIGKPEGSCSSGPCTASGEWEINGAELGVGAHQLKVTAIDNAGNVATEEFTLRVHHATPVSVGPGAVGPLSGEFSMHSTDVSVGAPGSSLTVSRSYGSRHLTAGSEGPLGPQWSLSVGSQESITKLETGSVTLTAASGGQTTFAKKESGGFSSPTGDASLSLSEAKNVKGEVTEYVLKDSADAVTTRFTYSSGPAASLWKPTKQEGPLAAQTVRYIFQTVEGVTEPKWSIAPEPAGISSCLSKAEKSEALVKGCRALEFKYATSTKATGENEKEWGEYKGRLKQVLFDAYNLSSKKMEEPGVAVAEYSYDKQGRLRAEWDPRLEHLKTIYGYDTEGHVSALTPPGQETWAFTYGTITGDPNAGRLLKATQAPASVGLWGGEAPLNSVIPVLSGSTVPGLRMAVSNGTWSNSPVAYGYRWEDCNTEGKECTPILGATNANYTPNQSDVGHTLVAEVMATNGGGTVVAASVASHPVASDEEYSLPKSSEPYGIVTGSDGNLWFTDLGTKKIGKITTSGTITEYSSGEYPFKITSGSDKNLWFTGGITSKIGKMTTSGALTEYALPAWSLPWGITAGPDSNLWFTDFATSKVGKITTSGTITEYPLPEKSEPKDITTGSDKNLWFADSRTSKIGKITTSGTITEYSLPAGSGPDGITPGPDGDLWFTDYGTSKIGKITTSGTITEYPLPSGSNPEEITTGSDKNLWFTAHSSSKVGKITTSGTITEYPLLAGSGPVGITGGPDENVWIANETTSTIGKVNPKLGSLPEGEQHTPGPGWTMEYHLPLSGMGLPTLTKEEVEKWSQKDDPTEGMAIFPPDEPQGWPATSYKRASITYLDELGRTVNAASPTGGISTTEYNETNDLVRSLSADNRAAALKEGCKSKTECKSTEVSTLLDTESTYNSTGSEPGTELLSTLGPQHTVKLANGTQVEARSHTLYSYNEGAPSEGAPYHLVTKTTQGAQYASKEEDVRTTTTSYSNEENLGWKLRKPTSITTDSNGLKLTHTIAYETSTGNVKETTMPAPGEQITEYPLPAASDPTGVVTGPDKNLWFTNVETSKIGKSTASGAITEYSLPEKSYPWEITVGPEKYLWFTDVGTSKIGKITTSGAITEYSLPEKCAPRGITEGPDGNIWFTDENTSKIVKITTSGTITEYSLPEKSEPWSITAAPGKENVLWFTDLGTSKIGKITTSGAITEYSLPEKSEPDTITAGPDGNLWFTDFHTSKIGKITTAGTITEYSLPKESLPDGITVAPDKNLWFVEAGPANIARITTAGVISEYSVGAFGRPSGITTGPDGNVWFANSRVNKIGKVSLSSWVGNAGAHDTQTIYYTTEANSKYPGCGEHPEWANLPCQSQPAEQPETSGLPTLPVIKYNAYNMLDEFEKETETVGSATRTTTMTYDAAGRQLTSEETSTEGKALPKVTDKYSETTGQLTEQSTTAGSETKTITSKYNKLGQLLQYTDADGNTTTYEYEPENDGRLTHVNDGKGTTTYSYNETTGALSKLVDTQGTNALTFTASYDVEGNITSESYPNGMTATYTHNTTGQTTGITYEKTTDCTEKCVWFTENVTPSIHEQILEQISSLGKDNYTYDQSGRLTQVQETPAGKGCTTRIYAYEADTNRTSLTTEEPNSKGECTTEGGTEEKHSYDSADRLTDTGIAYDAFGDITKLPATDAGGYELSSSFYADGQLEGQTQNGQSISYQLDPAHRTRETTDNTTATISHYTSPSNTPSWTLEPVSGHWSRYVSGISGFAAIETSTTEPELQLTNLQGDVVAKASLSETATKLLSTERSTEYGVPTTTKPAKYSWLASDLLATELPSGIVAMGARSYVPQIGRFLQTDPQPGGSANAYAYTYGDPINSSDPSGEYTAEVTAAGMEVASETGAEAAAERKAAEEAAARAEAEHKAAEAAFWSQGVASEAPEPPEPPPSVIYIGEEENNYGGGGSPHFITDPATGCTAKGAAGCKDSHGGHGNSNEGGTGSCRSGGSRNKKGQCQPGHGSVPNDCAAVGSAVGGAIGGGAFGEYGSLIGGVIGGAAGQAVCGNGKT
jgi:RHS repeat-associated protein